MGQPSPAAIQPYDLNDLVRLTATVIGTNGQVAVASLGIFLVKAPNGSVATYSSGDGNASVFNTGSGGFERLVMASMAGSWFYRFQATGLVITADEWSFMVAPSFIL
jgi:hypothetical protein